MRLFCFVLLMCSTGPAFAQLSLSLNEDSQFVLSGVESAVLGVNLESPSGILIPGADAGPFQFPLANQENIVAYGSLRNYVSVDGELALPVRFTEGAANDVFVQYGTPTKTYELHPIDGETAQWTPPIHAASRAVRSTVVIADVAWELSPYDFLIQMYDDEPLISTATFSSFQLRDSFGHEAFGGFLEFEGDRGEFYNDGTSSLPAEWKRRDIGEFAYLVSLPRAAIATPEPASCSLLLLGCGILLTQRKPSFRKKN